MADERPRSVCAWAKSAEVSASGRSRRSACFGAVAGKRPRPRGWSDLAAASRDGTTRVTRDCPVGSSVLSGWPRSSSAVWSGWVWAVSAGA